jgi:Zn-dependent peptidase ImmA (M78 family)
LQMKSLKKAKRVEAMGYQQVSNADRVGEAFALQVLSEHFGAEIFIGSSIEMKIEELASVVYKEIEDPEFFGATITLDRGNRKFVLLNTCKSLRLRYFTAAHELWHILNICAMIKDDIDQERAAERFAAALMLPESLVRSLVRSFGENNKDENEEKRLVIRIADISSAPYVAIAKRLVELNLTTNKKLADYSEKDWIKIRKDLNIVESPLDIPLLINRFTAYEERIAQEVQNGELNYLEASKRLANVSPDKSIEYAQKRAASSKLILEELDKDHEDILDEMYRARGKEK